MASKSNLIADTKKFVENHLGKGIFAPHTGQDWPAWCSFVYLVQCWTQGGGDAAIAAMRATARCAQPKVSVLHTFVQAIPAIADWSHVSLLWPQIAGGDSADTDWIQFRGVDRDVDPRELWAVERDWNYDELGKRTTVRKVTLHGWRKAKGAPTMHPQEHVT